MKNPWAYQDGRGKERETLDCITRQERVREMDAGELEAVIAWPATQPTVRKEAQRRLATIRKRHGRSLRDKLASAYGKSFQSEPPYL